MSNYSCGASVTTDVSATFADISISMVYHIATEPDWTLGLQGVEFFTTQYVLDHKGGFVATTIITTVIIFPTGF